MPRSEQTGFNHLSYLLSQKYAHEKVVLISHLFFFSFLLQACASLVNYRHDPKRSSKSPELVIDLTFSNSHKRF